MTEEQDSAGLSIADQKHERTVDLSRHFIPYTDAERRAHSEDCRALVPTIGRQEALDRMRDALAEFPRANERPGLRFYQSD